MKNIYLIIIASILLSGCFSPDRIPDNFGPNSRLNTPIFSINSPSKNNDNLFEFWRKEDNHINLRKEINNNMMNQWLSFYYKLLEEEYGWIAKSIYDDKGEVMLLDKNRQKEFENSLKYLNADEMDSLFEGGIPKLNYMKKYINYVNNLKCYSRVKVNYTFTNIGKKTFVLGCPYYDKTGNIKILRIGYGISVNQYGNIIFNSNGLVKLDNQYSYDELEKEFFNTIKETLDSLETHDMDVDRMKKEGLYYNKKFDLNAEPKAKEIKFDCYSVNETEFMDYHLICKQENRECIKIRKGTKRVWECKKTK